MANAQETTTARDILTAIQKTQVKIRPSPESSHAAGLGISMDECYPGIYIGDLGAAKNKGFLKKMGITHVLNTAQGSKFATVDTDADYYRDAGIKYMGMKLLDFPSANITQYFDSGAMFIEEALSGGGKVLVHCFMGISRSSTIACAYLMLKKRMSAVEAIQTLRQNRAIYPNDGFLQQLADLDNKLKKERSNL
ncbi:dual specificity protein phosphatase 3-like [Eriocheir sinensis]|uniref:dual specificity protein phosphatase 3-like n=1 Tax=Eriocheir sinensis TaxID=95602 RepID=UPI0021C62146|nr:dual specificity protein phosphatase 3-like [Eriocheir sinensis]XP_050727603.1 dual specificity protein phosphatase 3-like [Eriocheir sinensis]XP_050727605.1 dual specificity protein phosphatase 3-like [Eriocheir sinensis]